VCEVQSPIIGFFKEWEIFDKAKCEIIFIDELEHISDRTSHDVEGFRYYFVGVGDEDDGVVGRSACLSLDILEFCFREELGDTAICFGSESNIS
jgi:hypothetical protein